MNEELASPVAWLEARFAALVGPEQAQALQQIEGHFAALLGALEQALGKPCTEEALALAGLLGARFGWMRGRPAETAALCLRALALDGGSPERRALAHEGAAASLFALGDFLRAAEHAEQSERGYLTQAQEAARCRAKNLRGQIAREQGDLTLAERLHSEALSLARGETCADRWAASMALSHLGVVAAKQNRPAEARALHQQALALREELGDVRGIASSLANLASLLREQEPGEASALLERVIQLRSSIQDDWGAANASYLRARLLLSQGDAPGAEQGAWEALRRSEALGDRLGCAEALELLASILAPTNPEQAVEAIDQAATKRLDAGADLPLEIRKLRERLAAR